jgi:hypothetical protein
MRTGTLSLAVMLSLPLTALAGESPPRLFPPKAVGEVTLPPGRPTPEAAGPAGAAPEEPKASQTPAPKPKRPKIGLKGANKRPERPEGQKSSGEKLLGVLGRDLDISGVWSLTSRANAISGSSQAQSWYNYQNNNPFVNARPLGPFQQNLNVTVQGTVLDVFRVHGSLSNNRFASSTGQSLLGLDYDDLRGTKAQLGDVNASLSGNELVNYARNLRGIQFSREFGRGMKLTSVASITRALTRRGSFQGQGTTGPYFLNAQQIIAGSVRVLLNGQELVEGTDYDLDYMGGRITFRNSRIVNAQDTVEYTYEAQNLNTQAGILTGLRWDMPVSGGTAGVTFLSQRATGGGVGGGDRAVTQYFAVYGDINYRYFLQSPAQENTPVEVRYQDRVLAEGQDKDYIYNRSLNFIQLRRALPPDTAITGIASLSATFQPVRQVGVGGSKQLLGLDTNMKLSSTSRLAMQFGQSSGAGGANSGTGLTITASTEAPSKARRPWRLSTTLRNIAPGFSGIDSTASAFLRAESGFTTTLAVTPSERVNLDATFGQSRIGSTTSTQASSTTATTPTTLWSNDQRLNASLRFSLPDRGSLRMPGFVLRHTDRGQSSTASATGSRSSYTNDELEMTWSPRADNLVAFTASLGRTNSRGTSVFATGYTDTVGTGSGLSDGTVLGGYRNGTAQTLFTNGKSDNARMALTLTPSERLTVTGTLGTVRSNSGNSATSARDTGLQLSYSPLRALQLQVGVTESTNGQSTSGYYSSAGTTGSSESSITGQKATTRDASLTWTPAASLSLTLRGQQQLALIPGYDSSDSRSTEVQADYFPNPLLRVSAFIGRQNVAYVGGQGDSSNLNYMLSTQHGPFGRLTITTSLTRMNFGSSTFYGRTGGSSLGSGSFGGSSLGGATGSSLTGYFQNGINTSATIRGGYAVGPTQVFFQWVGVSQGSPGASTTVGGTDSGTYHSAINYRDSEARMGVDWRFTELLGLTFETRLATRKDRDDPRYSYKARTMNLDLSMRF